MKESIGLIEVVGLVAAIQALDVAVKTALVRPLGIENSQGGGQMTVKLAGEVAAVAAAVEAGSAAARQIGQVYASRVLSSPCDELDTFFFPPAAKPTAPSAPHEQLSSCNLCGDIACKRQQGEAKALCIHNKTTKNRRNNK